MGQRLKLGCEDSIPGGISVFDTQIRRRLWWQILFIDGRAGQLSGQSVSFADKPCPPLPANVNDVDINPTMTAMPPTHGGPTEMILCLARYEVGVFLYEHGTGLHDPKTPVSGKDELIRLLESRLTEKYLKYCDPAVPLHILTAGGSRSVLHKLSMMAHHPAQYPDKGKSLPQSDHDSLFSHAIEMNSIHLLGYVEKAVEGFLWHIDAYFQLDAFVFMLIESRAQPPTAPLTERAWNVTNDILEYRSELTVDDGNELHSSVRQLVAQIWAAREAAARRQRLAPPKPTPAISRLLEMVSRSQPGQKMGQLSASRLSDRVAHLSDGLSSDTTAVVTPDDSSSQVGDTGPGDFQYQASDESFLQLDVTSWENWGYWEDLLRGQPQY